MMVNTFEMIYFKKYQRFYFKISTHPYLKMEIGKLDRYLFLQFVLFDTV